MVCDSEIRCSPPASIHRDTTRYRGGLVVLVALTVPPSTKPIALVGPIANSTHQARRFRFGGEDLDGRFRRALQASLLPGVVIIVLPDQIHCVLESLHPIPLIPLIAVTLPLNQVLDCFAMSSAPESPV